MDTVYTFSAKDITGKDIDFNCYKDKVLLIVNVASKCGFTKQYAGLEELYRKYCSQGFEILGFPCNQFSMQEPGDEAEIQQFCSLNYNVTFPLFSKIEVNGENTHPLYRFLKHQCNGIFGSEKIKWNFTKFLVNKHGKVIRRYASVTEPSKLTKYIEQLIKEKL